MISKLSRNPKMKSQDHTSRSKRPDERIGRGHAPKRVARRASFAAKLRQKPGFCGNLDEISFQFLWAGLSRTLRPSAPINIPAGAAEGASRDVLGFSFSYFSLNFKQVVIFISSTLWKKELVFGRRSSNKGYLFPI